MSAPFRGETGGAHILVVEDEPHIAEALIFLLEREGHVVTWEENGASALATFDEGIDLVILDIMLPGASGFEVAAKLRENARPPKICVLSAKGQAADRSRMEALGVDAFVTKPFANKALMETVQLLLRHRSSTSGAGRTQKAPLRHEPG